MLTVPCRYHIPFQTCSQYNRKLNTTFFFFFFGGGCEQRAKYAICSRDPQIETTIQEFIQTWLIWPLKSKDLITIVWTLSIIFCLSRSCPADVEDDIKLNMLFLLWGILSLSCVQMFKTVVAFPPTLFQEERIAEPPTRAWSVDSFLSESQNPGQRLKTCDSLEMWLKGWDAYVETEQQHILMINNKKSVIFSAHLGEFSLCWNFSLPFETIRKKMFPLFFSSRLTNLFNFFVEGICSERSAHSWLVLDHTVKPRVEEEAQFRRRSCVGNEICNVRGTLGAIPGHKFNMRGSINNL